MLGFIFVVGIKVANTVLMTDFAQELRHSEGLTPTQTRVAELVRSTAHFDGGSFTGPDSF